MSSGTRHTDEFEREAVRQFAEPVPELLSGVLVELAGQPDSAVHAFFVSALDALNELAPAEVLAASSTGCRLCTRRFMTLRIYAS